MANKSDNNFDIPGIIILLAFAFCFPVGVVLLIIKALAKENEKKKTRENPYYKSEQTESKTKKNNKKKKSKAGAVTGGFAIALLVFSLFMSIAPLTSATSLSS